MLSHSAASVYAVAPRLRRAIKIREADGPADLVLYQPLLRARVAP